MIKKCNKSSLHIDNITKTIHIFMYYCNIISIFFLLQRMNEIPIASLRKGRRKGWKVSEVVYLLLGNVRGRLGGSSPVVPESVPRGATCVSAYTRKSNQRCNNLDLSNAFQAMLFSKIKV